MLNAGQQAAARLYDGHARDRRLWPEEERDRKAI